MNFHSISHNAKAAWSFTFLVVSGSGGGGDVVPLGQSVGVPNTELLSCRDFSQHSVENLLKNKSKRINFKCLNKYKNNRNNIEKLQQIYV